MPINGTWDFRLVNGTSRTSRFSSLIVCNATLGGIITFECHYFQNFTVIFLITDLV